MPLAPTAHLLHKYTLLRLGDVGAVPNTNKKQPKWGDKYVPHEQQKAPKREFTKMETSNIPDTEFKIPIIGCSRNLRKEYVNSEL